MTVGNAQALIDLQASVDALVAAGDNVPPDISAAVETAVTGINGVTTLLGGTPPVAGGTTTTATPAAVGTAGLTAGPVAPVAATEAKVVEAPKVEPGTEPITPTTTKEA